MFMEQKMIEHHASVTVDAPVHQVYSLFSHFNDFPKFMSFVKEVTYHDAQRSHWVADVAGRHEWDAENEDWIPDRQIGWRSYDGLSNTGRVVFQPTSTQQTHIDVYVNYNPPASLLGSIGEHLGVGKHFENALQKDLNHFAEMVSQSPPGALDPTSSNYLFHPGSAAARGTTTERQNATMGEEASSTTPVETGTPVRDEDYATRSGTGATAQGGTVPPQGAPLERPVLDQDIINEPASATPSAGAPSTAVPPERAGTDEESLPPEQIPRWGESPEGGQPRP
jgi:uncharacterized membrane protein